MSNFWSFDEHFTISYVTILDVSFALVMAWLLWKLWRQTKPYRIYWLLRLRGQEAKLGEEKLKAFFDDYARVFDNNLVSHLGYRGPRLIGRLLRKHLDAQAKLEVADLGCGTGLCAKELSQFAKTLTGVDLSPKMLEQAKKRRCYSELIQADVLEFLEDRPSSFDLICACDMVIYLNEPARFYELAAQALRPGGYLILTTEVSDTALSMIYRGRRKEMPAATRGLIRNSGLAITDFRREKLRLEAGEWVESAIFLCQRAPSGTQGGPQDFKELIS